MKVKILKVIEKGNTLEVHTETDYGKDRFGLSIKQKYLDPKTDKPRYLSEVKMHLEQKYEKQMIEEKEVDKHIWEKEYDLDKLDKKEE